MAFDESVAVGGRGTDDVIDVRVFRTDMTKRFYMKGSQPFSSSL
jgi:hypothetical protein